MKLLGTTRTDTCRGCIAGRDKNGPGCGKPFSRTQRVIAVRAKTFTIQCGVCKTKNVRKMSSLTTLPKRERLFASLEKKKSK